MRLLYLLLASGLVFAPAQSALAADAGCQAEATLVLRVQFADEAPRHALLRSAPTGGLVLHDPDTGRELWSASASPASTQRIAGMDAAFGSSLTALHLDADGLHDRIYAGDRAGRLWRLDLRAGARPSAWMRPGLLADFSVPEGGRGFTAPPDITRIQLPDNSNWLNIAIGTANTGVARNDHRFYVLRDVMEAAPPAAPLTEADLEPLAPPLTIHNTNARGFYLSLGASQVLAQALTLNGYIHYTAVESGHGVLAACNSGTSPTTAVLLSVTIIRAEDGALVADRDGNGHTDQRDLRRVLPRPLPANSGVSLASVAADIDGRLPCTVADESLPECFLDTRPRRTWWRREDAD